MPSLGEKDTADPLRFRMPHEMRYEAKMMRGSIAARLSLLTFFSRFFAYEMHTV